MARKSDDRGKSRGKFILGGIAGAFSFGVVRGPAKPAQFEFKCAAALAFDHPTISRSRQMWAAVEKESGGRIHTQTFANSQLGGDAAMISQLRVGAIQFYIGLPNLSTIVPALEVTQVGLAFGDDEEALAALDGRLGDYIRKELVAKGLFDLKTIYNNGMRQITSSSHPIRTADDLNGFKIRVAATKIGIEFFRALGASPAPLSTAELYTALQTKIVDGEDMPLGSIEAQRYYEVQKYLSLTNHSWNGTAMVTNLDVWKRLPADLQDIIERNNTKYALIARRDMNTVNSSVAEGFARRGIAVNRADTSTFRGHLHGYYESWSKEFGPTVWGLLQSSVRSRLG